MIRIYECKDLVDLTLPTDDWAVMSKEIEPARGPSGFVYAPFERSLRFIV